jgi:dTDP-4-amino-4,6-dideoxygalactose transaminase
MSIRFSPPDISEIEINNVVEVLKSGWITTGPKTKLFESKIAGYCKTAKAVCLNSATACLELTLKLFGIGKGDEVITSAYTYTASASVIEHVGAKIVLTDTAPNSYEMCYDQLERLISPKTKAIIPVDIGGVACDYSKIFEIVAKKSNIFTPSSPMQKALGRVLVLSDAAHSFGATQNGLMAGNIADFTCFSFHAVKNLTTAEGGAVTWRRIEGVTDEEIYKQYMLMSLHGQTKDAFSKSAAGQWEYDIAEPFYKCNMTDVAAAMGLGQLERYDSLIKKRAEIVNAYNLHFKNTKIMPLVHFGNGFSSSVHLYLTRVEGATEERRNEIIVKLAQKEIPANVHYKPLAMLSAYKKLGFDIKNYPNAYNQYKNEITLPLHTLLTKEDVDYIATAYKEIVLK